jgi:hypothetical protein
MYTYIRQKDKIHPRTEHEGPQGKQRYSSKLSLTSALDVVGGRVVVNAKRSLYSFYRRLAGIQDR